MPPQPPPPRWRRRRGRRVFVFVFVFVGLLPVPVPLLVPVLGSLAIHLVGRQPIVPPSPYRAFAAAATADITVALVVPPHAAAAGPGRKLGRARRSLLQILGAGHGDAAIMGGGGDHDDDFPRALDELLGLMDEGPSPGDADADATGSAPAAVSSSAVSSESSSSSTRRITTSDGGGMRRRARRADDDDTRGGTSPVVPVPWADTRSDQLRHRHHHPLLASLDYSPPSSPDEDGGNNDGNDKRKQFHPGRGGYNATLLLECEFDVPKYIVKRDEIEWDAMVGLLREFRSLHGHCRVPTSYEGYRRMRMEEKGESTENASDEADSEDGVKDVKRLIRWVRLQRRLYKKLTTMLAEDGRDDHESGKGRESLGGEQMVVGATEGWTMLTPERVNTLTDLGFDFDPGRGPRHLASVRLDELRRFHEQHGHVDVPPRYPPNPRLASWVAEQRLQYRRLMEEEEEEKMRRTGTWSGSGASDEARRRRIYSSRTEPEFLEELRRLGFDFEPPKRGGGRRRRKEGRGSSTTTSSGLGSGEVTGSTGKEVVVDEEKEDADENWDEMVEELQQFRSAHGHCHVPHTHGRLGRWTYLQRRRYRHHVLCEGETEDDGGEPSSQLTLGRIDELRSMGFDWDVTEVEIARRAHDVAWREMLDELVAFRGRYGHVRVPVDYGEHHDLGLWVVRQRRYGELSMEGEASSPLTRERVDLLEGLGVFDDDDEGPPQLLGEGYDPRRDNVRIAPLVSRRDGGVT